MNPRGHRHRSLPDAGVAVGEKDGTLHQYPPAAAMARQGRQRTGRQPVRALVHLSSRAPAEAALCRQHGAPATRRSATDLGLPDRGRRAGSLGRSGPKEINGYTWPDAPADRRASRSSRTTAPPPAACWLYCGVFPKEGHNQARARRADGPDGPGHASGLGIRLAGQPPEHVQPGLGRPGGQPWSERKRLISWDPAQGNGSAPTRRFRGDEAPRLPAGLEQAAHRHGGARRRLPVHHDRRRQDLAVHAIGAQGRAVPTHYEPVESPVQNPLYRQQSNPVAKIWQRPDNPFTPRRSAFPYALTTYRLTEHHCGRHPDADRCRSPPNCSPRRSPKSRRSSPTRSASAISTGSRFRPCAARSKSRRWSPTAFGHFGSTARPSIRSAWPGISAGRAIATGDIANLLTAVVGDPNTSIHEDKALTCDLRRGRRARRTETEEMADERPSASAGLSDSFLTGVIPDEAELTAGDADRAGQALWLLHRHDTVHRLQGLRGRLQGVERLAGRRYRPARHQLRQYGRPFGDDLAACRTSSSRSRRAASGRRKCRRSRATG